jgi:hypothetical protein
MSHEKIKNLMEYRTERYKFNKKYYKISNQKYQPFIGKENYYQGLTAPFTNFYVRKDLTSLDIDSFIYDYKKKYCYFIEDKHLHEEKKIMQLKAFEWLAKLLKYANENKYKDWNIGFFYCTYNYNLDTVEIYNVLTKETKIINFDNHKLFLSGDILFDEL